MEGGDGHELAEGTSKGFQIVASQLWRIKVCVLKKKKKVNMLSWLNEVSVIL